jgi:hypothetical protein
MAHVNTSYDDFSEVVDPYEEILVADDDQLSSDEMQQQQRQQQVLDAQYHDPSFIARKQMELRAKNLIQQVELIETSSKDGRSNIKSFISTMERRSSNSSELLDDSILPPRLVALSLSSSSTSNGSNSYSTGTKQSLMQIDILKDWMFDSGDCDANSSTDQLSQQQEFKQQQSSLNRYQETSLADDLSSNDDASRIAAGNIDNGNEELQYYKNRSSELEVENQRLRDMVSTCCKAAINLQTNADLKIVRLEMEIAHLRQQLSDELANNSRVIVLNQSLRKQLNMAASDIIQKKQQGLSEKKKFFDFIQLHQRELTVEKHLNGLIITRNHAVKECTELKKILLSTCYECRQRIPRRRRRSLASTAPNEDGIDTKSYPSIDESQESTSSSITSTPSRPTYQSSARQLVLDQQVATSRPTTLNGNSPIKIKSCLKKRSTDIFASNDSIDLRSEGQPSPTSATAIIVEPLPKSLKIGKSHKQSDTSTSSNTHDNQNSSDERRNSIRANLRLFQQEREGKQKQKDEYQRPHTDDCWSSTSDLSGTIISNNVEPECNVVTPMLKIPTAAHQRKEDLQRHDKIVSGKSQRSGGSFFNLRKKKEPTKQLNI